MKDDPLAAAAVVSGSPVQDQVDASEPPPEPGAQEPAAPAQQPPPPSQVEQAQADLSTALKYALIAALLWYVLNDSRSSRGGDGLFDYELVNVSKWSRRAAFDWIASVASVWGMDAPSLSYDLSPSRLASRIETTSNRWAADHVDDARKRGTDPLLDPDVPIAERRSRAEKWADNAARTLATQLASETVLKIAQSIDPRDADGNQLTVYKVWLTRSDARVRSSHRDLHGKPVPLDEPFKTWPITHKQLMYPGDPSAPLREFIGCRCFLWFAWGTSPLEVAKSLEADIRLFGVTSAGESFDDSLLACSHDPVDVEIATLYERTQAHPPSLPHSTDA